MLKRGLIVSGILLLSLLLFGCGVPQADYDAIQRLWKIYLISMRKKQFSSPWIYLPMVHWVIRKKSLLML